MELNQVIQLKGDTLANHNINASDENTETGADEAPMRATIHVDANAPQSFMQMLEDEVMSDGKDQFKESTFGKNTNQD